MEATTLEVLDVVGTWIAAIGTVGAVVTSLWMSYNSNKVKLKASATSAWIINPAVKIRPQICQIVIVNTGSKTLIVNSIGWEVGSFKKQVFYQVLSGSRQDKVPKTLLESEEGIFTIDFEGEGDWLKGMAKTAKEYNINTLKLVISTSVGQTFKIKADKFLIKAIKDERDNIKT